jgi:phosphoglycerate kinase
MAAYDIGPVTRHEFAAVIRDARTFFWNGPMGWFEAEGYDAGTRAVAAAAAEASRQGTFCVIGGGDSARAVHEAGLAARVSHVSTGGGAALEYLAHGTLPGLEALDDA